MCGAASLVVVFLPSPSMTRPFDWRPALEAPNNSAARNLEFLPADIDPPVVKNSRYPMAVSGLASARVRPCRAAGGLPIRVLSPMAGRFVGAWWFTNYH